MNRLKVLNKSKQEVAVVISLGRQEIREKLVKNGLNSRIWLHAENDS